MQPAQINIILDDDKCEWKQHFDPHMDILFGKYGLIDRYWVGDSYFDAETDVLEHLLGMHLENCRAQAIQVAEEQSAECGEPVDPEPLDEMALIEQHREYLKSINLIQTAVFSKTKFAKDLSEE